MAQQPGIMLYFELLNPIEKLSYKDKGRLLEAALRYGCYGEVPEFRGTLGAIWDFMQPRLDRDREQYRRVALRNAYNAYSAQEKRAGRLPMSMEQWTKQREEAERLLSEQVPASGDRWFPTTASPTAPSTKSTTNSISLSTSAPASAPAPVTEADPQPDFEQLRRERMAMLRQLG